MKFRQKNLLLPHSIQVHHNTWKRCHLVKRGKWFRYRGRTCWTSVLGMLYQLRCRCVKKFIFPKTTVRVKIFWLPLTSRYFAPVTACLFQSGEVVPCVHIGKGVIIREDVSKCIRQALRKVWPWDYGKKAPNSKSTASKAHRKVYDLIIASVWPPGTETKFFAIEGFPPRAAFHNDRLSAVVGWLADVWADLVGTEFPCDKVRDFITNRVS